MPERLQLSRRKGYRIPPGAVNVARPGKWGNPFAVGKPNGLGWGDVRNNLHAVQLFTRWLYLRPTLVLYERDRHTWMLDHLNDLRGRDLACWCKPDQPCHASVLLIVANSTTFAHRHDEPEATPKTTTALAGIDPRVLSRPRGVKP
ncbi:MAG: DUF4326 domain-containing protein [Georgenia sp.]